LSLKKKTSYPDILLSITTRYRNALLMSRGIDESDSDH